jgi:hypothetical protein
VIRTLRTIALTILVCGTALGEEIESSFRKEIAPFFKEYCTGCHNAKKNKGKLRLDNIVPGFGDQEVAETWDEIMLKLSSGEMPPEDEQKHPTAEAAGEVVVWIAAGIREGNAIRMALRGPVAHYRLSRAEYAHTVADLLGVHYDPTLPGGLNEDPLWHGYDRIGSRLTLSPSHVERYYSAASAVVQQAYPDRPTSVSRQEQRPKQDRWLMLPGRHEAGFRIHDAGQYRLRLKLSGLPSFKGRLPHLALWHVQQKKSVSGKDILAPEGRPGTIEIETFLAPGEYRLVNETPGDFGGHHAAAATPRTIRTVAGYNPPNPLGYKLFLDDGQAIVPLILLDEVVCEGPILEEAVRAERTSFFPAADKPAAIRQCLQRFMERAWRRSVSNDEVAAYEALVRSERGAGESFRSAYSAAMIAVLSSKNFVYLAEGSPGSPRQQINDWELASRLSHFLWSSTPDETLLSLAADGKLRSPQILAAQLQRLLADPKADRFLDAFPRQWLRLHRVGEFPPDNERYPDYDDWLEKSMVRETTAYFAEVFRQNLSVGELLDSDWTMMNSRLAMHYGLPKPEQADFQRVSLAENERLGGILTHASVLSLTSDGTRHRPVHRGVWVYATVFGREPPPPPPNVEPLEPTPPDKNKVTIRQQLEAHASNAQCASCHSKIDPLGFAFDNFDAIGRWRTHAVTASGSGEPPAVNAGGKLIDGRAFTGPAEFRQLLVRDVNDFAGVFTEQLATYALRRVMTLDDREAIKQIAISAKADDYGLRSMIEALVNSPLFLRR